MTTTDKPGDPADKGLDQFVSHRAGYGDDKLGRLVAWLRAHPTTTLASGEGALLLAEIDRLRRILAALREPSSNVIESANVAFPFAAPMIRAAVAAAEQEVGRE